MLGAASCLRASKSWIWRVVRRHLGDRRPDTPGRRQGNDMTIIEIPTTTTPTSPGHVRFDPPLDDLARSSCRSRPPGRRPARGRGGGDVQPRGGAPARRRRGCHVQRGRRGRRVLGGGQRPAGGSPRHRPRAGARRDRRRHGDHVPARQRRDRRRAAHCHRRRRCPLGRRARGGGAVRPGRRQRILVLGGRRRLQPGRRDGPAEPAVRVRSRPGPGGRDGHRRRRGAATSTPAPTRTCSGRCAAPAATSG